LNLSEVAAFQQSLLACSAALGSRFPQIAEPRDLNTRKGLVARKKIAKGEMISVENAGFAWPPLGIKSEDWSIADGQRAAKDLAEGDVINWSDIHFG
jgi:sialic acid synthase SpsE